ncbi:hypothetical protein FQN55_001424 [Onygenales sp. PD_40]|nr:hypothetical protein FQN55_001424 [Onygenales sp. PD_40]
MHQPSTMADSRLFRPLKIGNMEVKHRIAMAPLTRLRATVDRVPTPLMVEYYSQRASIPGTLIFAESIAPSPAACGNFVGGPGIWSQEQVTAWKAITDEVHKRGCFIVCQLYGFGRAAISEVAKSEGIDIVAPSAIPIDDNSPIPRAMTTQEINQMVQDFATASKNAISAGFDGVECHAANGYLLDQFLQEGSNQRDDEYGGSVENRSRFPHEVLKAMVDAVGPAAVGLRLSPWSTFQVKRMKDPIPQYTDIINKASRLNIAWLDLIESRVAGGVDVEASGSLDFAYRVWRGPIIVGGGYKPVGARKHVDEEYPDKDIVVMFGRQFISNPDLVYRIKKGLELNAYDRNTFYTNSAAGYVDYPMSKEYMEREKVQISPA